jgi:hypothetical protein
MRLSKLVQVLLYGCDVLFDQLEIQNVHFEYYESLNVDYEIISYRDLIHLENDLCSDEENFADMFSPIK